MNPPERPRRRVAIVVQRYGVEINGGAELLARVLAERLAQQHEVDVLTGCARDYATWAPSYPPGPSELHGVRVLRFEHPLRNDIGRARVPLVHKLRFKLRRLLRQLPGPLVLPPRGDPAYDGEDFLRRQGPYTKGLFSHLAAARDRYDVVIFFTALYAPSAVGLRHWTGPAILVPLLHDEKPMYLPVFGALLRRADALLFNTDAERRLAARMYGIDTAGCAIAGLGVDVQRPTPAALAETLQGYGLAPGYIVYAGRIDVSKGCRELVEAFIEHAAADPEARLVLVGRAVMTVPEHPRIHCTGFVSDAERDALMAGAATLVIPSRYESLSLVLLEAMQLHTPVIANAACEVLAEHVQASGAGIAYRGRLELLAAMRRMTRLAPAERERLGRLGADYVQRQYAWPRVMQVLNDSIEQVIVQSS